METCKGVERLWRTQLEERLNCTVGVGGAWPALTHSFPSDHPEHAPPSNACCQ